MHGVVGTGAGERSSMTVQIVHHREVEPGEGRARRRRVALRRDSGRRGPPAGPVRARGGEPRVEALVGGAAQARRAVCDEAGGGGQQGGQAQGHRQGVAHRRPGVARHRLRPRRTAHRAGDPRALPLPRRGAAGDVHRAGPAKHPRGVRPRPAQRRACPALRRGGGAPAGRPDLQPVADPHRDGDARARGARGDRGRAGEDADARDRVPARVRDPRLRCGALLRGRGRCARRRWGVPDAPRTEGAHRRARAGASGGGGGARLRGSAAGAGREPAPAPAEAARPALASEARERALRLVGVEDAGGGPGALRRGGEEDPDLPARRGALPSRERHRRRGGDRRRAARGAGPMPSSRCHRRR